MIPTASRRARAVISATLIGGVALSLAACSGGTPSGEQTEGSDYPNDTIELVVPFAAGGPTDTVARIIAEPMSAELGEQVVVKNVEGAGGTIAIGEVGGAEPDGYTALIHHIGMSTAPSLYADLRFDPIADFKAVGLVTEVPMTIVSRKGLGPTDFEELAAYLEENGEAVTIAHAGLGSASNLCATLLQQELGVTLQEVPYDGTGPAMTDILGGQVDLLCDQTTNTTSPITAGLVDAYAVTTPERVEVIPDVPTTEEEGHGDLDISIWHGVYLPKDTPDEVVTKLEAALQAALADETVATQFANLGTAPSSAEDATPKALASKLSEQTELWAGILKQG